MLPSHLCNKFQTKKILFLDNRPENQLSEFLIKYWLLFKPSNQPTTLFLVSFLGMNQSGARRFNPYGHAAYNHNYGNTTASSSTQNGNNNNNNNAKWRDTTYCSNAENSHLLKTDYIHNPFYTQRFFITKPHLLNTHNYEKGDRRSHELRFRMPFDWYQKVSSTSEKYELILRIYETKSAHVDYLPHDIKVHLNERDAKTPPMGK